MDGRPASSDKLLANGQENHWYAHLKANLKSETSFYDLPVRH